MSIKKKTQVQRPQQPAAKIKTRTEPPLLRIFGILEGVFSGEKQWDEALMTLGIHTAELRSKFPSLYQALSSRNSGQPDLTDLIAASSDGVIRKVEDSTNKIISELVRVKLPVATRVYEPPASPEDAQRDPVINSIDDDIPITVGAIPYTKWALENAPVAKSGDKWKILWDVKAPTQAVGTALTLNKVKHAIKEAVPVEQGVLLMLETL